MEWMVTAAGDAPRASFKLTERGKAEFAERETELADGTLELAERKNAGSVLCPKDAASPAAAAARVMLLPPSYLYPVPNNAEGDLIGDGREDGVRDRAGHFFSVESLAAHLWGRSWQQGIS